jgi:hypothetical protein
MMATHELVVPRSIPITSPASVLFQRFMASNEVVPRIPFVERNDAAPRRRPIRSAMVLMVDVAIEILFLKPCCAGLELPLPLLRARLLVVVWFVDTPLKYTGNEDNRNILVITVVFKAAVKS